MSIESDNHSLRIGLFGAGIVGGGVYILIEKFIERFSKLGLHIEIVKICVKNLHKQRDFPLDRTKISLTTDYNEILDDSTINCVVELMGGITDAKYVVFEAIKRGKHVITANKALIAAYLAEIESLLSQNPNVRFAYEAAVCGGIPIIHSLQSDFLANNITKVMGIMNGTTNFILSKMESEGSDYSVVLKEAQDLGYAEADPTADVEGYDVQAKIAILAKLAYGKTVPLNMITTKGISQVTKKDFGLLANYLKSTIKLIGNATLSDNGATSSLAVSVAPSVVSFTNLLSTAKGPGNMVLVNNDNMNLSSFIGPGAGRFPTANSVLNDIVRLAQQRTLAAFPLPDNSQITLTADLNALFYIRVSLQSSSKEDAASLSKKAQENYQITVKSTQTVSETEGVNDVILLTDESASFTHVQRFVSDLEQTLQSDLSDKPVFMPIIS